MGVPDPITAATEVIDQADAAITLEQLDAPLAEMILVVNAMAELLEVRAKLPEPPSRADLDTLNAGMARVRLMLRRLL